MSLQSSDEFQFVPCRYNLATRNAPACAYHRTFLPQLRQVDLPALAISLPSTQLRQVDQSPNA